jgi:hypothetical protein
MQDRPGCRGQSVVQRSTVSPQTLIAVATASRSRECISFLFGWTTSSSLQQAVEPNEIQDGESNKRKSENPDRVHDVESVREGEIHDDGEHDDIGQDKEWSIANGIRKKERSTEKLNVKTVPISTSSRSVPASLLP